MQVEEAGVKVKAVVMYEGEEGEEGEGVLGWAGLLALGDSVPDSELEARLEAQVLIDTLA